MKFNQLVEELVECHRREIEELQKNLRLENPDNTLLEQNNKLYQENAELQEQLQKSNQKIASLKAKVKSLKAQLMQQTTSMNGPTSSVDATIDPNIKNLATNIKEEENDAKDLDTSHDLSDSDPPANNKPKHDSTPLFSFSTLLSKKKSPEGSFSNNNNQDVSNGFQFDNSNSQPELYSRKRKKPVQFHDDFDMLTQAPNLDTDLVQSTIDTTTNNNNNNNGYGSKTQSIQIANTKIVSRYNKKTSNSTTPSTPFAVPPLPVSAKKAKAPNKIMSSLPDDEEFSVVDLNDEELQSRTNSKQHNGHDATNNFLNPTSVTPVKSPTTLSSKNTPSSKSPSPNNSHSDINNTSHNSNGSSSTPKRPIPFIVDLESDNEDENEGRDIVQQGSNKKFKYVEHVRKKADREALPSHECEECKKFMDAIDGEFKIDRQKMLQYCGRHRQLYAAPETPPDFWEVSFPDTETQDIHH